jgi:hypothetical protein
MLRKCAVVYSELEEQAMLAQLPQLVGVFGMKGLVPETSMDQALIPRGDIVDRRTLPKDQRALQHNRAVLISHVSILQRERERAAEKAASVALRTQAAQPRQPARPPAEQAAIDMNKAIALHTVTGVGWHIGTSVPVLKSAFKGFMAELPVQQRTSMPKKRDALVAGLDILLDAAKLRRIEAELVVVVMMP